MQSGNGAGVPQPNGTLCGRFGARQSVGARHIALAVALLVASATVLHAATDAQLRYGRHLASECTACHGAGGKGSDGAIPALAGRPAAEIVALIADYRAGRKTNPVMISVARSLDDNQTAALAAYFASLPAPDFAPAP